jgi:hypothetical protein
VHSVWEPHVISSRYLVAISAATFPHSRSAPSRARAMNEIGWRALMKLRRRDFLLFVTLTSAAAGPALGQPKPAVGLASPGSNQSSGSIPNLSGAWGHNFLLFEPPSAGPSPIVTKLHTPAGTLMFNAVGDYTNPILKPETAEVVKRSAEKELSGTAIPNPHNQCWPEPTPFTLNIQFGVKIIQQNDEVVLFNLTNQVRRVRLNVAHSPRPTPTWQGESVGHYEGDTLIVDTIGQKVGPITMIDSDPKVGSTEYALHPKALLVRLRKTRRLNIEPTADALPDCGYSSTASSW